MFTGAEFQSVRRALDEIPIIDTHEHYGEKWDSPETTLYDVMNESYLACANASRMPAPKHGGGGTAVCEALSPRS